MMRSPCCGAEVLTKREWLSLMGGEMWSDTTTCTACGQPCEPMEVKEGEK